MKCNCCGSDKFTEHTVEKFRQRGVMLRCAGGEVELDYDYATEEESSGASIMTGLICEGCGAEYGLDFNGKLVLSSPTEELSF